MRRDIAFILNSQAATRNGRLTNEARQRVVVKRSEKWSSSSLFSRARSRGLALPLFPFSWRCPLGPVEIRCRAGVLPGTFHHGNYCFGATYVSWLRVETADARSRVCARVCTAACGDYGSECIGTRTTMQVRAGRTSLRCKVPTRTISKITVDIRNYRLS